MKLENNLAKEMKESVERMKLEAEEKIRFEAQEKLKKETEEKVRIEKEAQRVEDEKKRKQEENKRMEEEKKKMEEKKLRIEEENLRTAEKLRIAEEIRITNQKLEEANLKILKVEIEENVRVKESEEIIEAELTPKIEEPKIMTVKKEVDGKQFGYPESFKSFLALPSLNVPMSVPFLAILNFSVKGALFCFLSLN